MALLDLDQSGSRGLLTSIGLGLLMSSMPQARGVSRGSVASPIILAGMKASAGAADKAQERKLRDLQIRKAEAGIRAGEAKAGRRASIAELMGINTEGPATALPGGYGAPAVTQQNLMSQPDANQARLRGLLAQEDPIAAYKALTRQPKAPDIQKFIEGNEFITKQWDPGSRQWIETSRAPRFQERQPGAPVEIYDSASPTGTRYATRREAIGKFGKAAKPSEPAYRNVIYPDGTKELVNTKDAKKMALVQLRKGQFYGQRVQSETAAGLVSGLTPRQSGAVHEEVAQGETNLVELNRARQMAARPEAEWATGLRGMFAENIGGPAAQIFGTKKAGILVGPDLAKIQPIRTTLQTVIGRQVKAVTGDTSGKYSDHDMAMVQTAARALDPTATVPQIKAAVDTLYGIEERATIRARLRTKGFSSIVVSDENAVAAYAKELKRLHPGISDEKAVRRAFTDLTIGNLPGG